MLKGVSISIHTCVSRMPSAWVSPKKGKLPGQLSRHCIQQPERSNWQQGRVHKELASHTKFQTLGCLQVYDVSKRYNVGPVPCRRNPRSRPDRNCLPRLRYRDRTDRGHQMSSAQEPRRAHGRRNQPDRRTLQGSQDGGSIEP